MSLINGMEDIMKHIKNQELRIQKLEQENKKLKEDIEGDGWLKQGYKTELSNSHKQQNRMVKEITKLKEENKRLKDENKQMQEKANEILQEWTSSLQEKSNEILQQKTQSWTKEELFELICDEGLWDEDDDEDDFDVEDWISSLQQQREELEEQNNQYVVMFNAVVKSEEEKVAKINKLEELIASIKKETDKAKK